MKWHFQIKTRRHLLLLEVLIACLLVAIVAIPLLSPLVWMAHKQQQLSRNNALNHWVHLFYAEMLEKLYRNVVPWEDLMKETPTSINNKKLEALGFSGSYCFSILYQKPKEKESLLHFYLLRFSLSFDDLNQGETTPMKYSYDLFVKNEQNSE